MKKRILSFLLFMSLLIAGSVAMASITQLEQALDQGAYGDKALYQSGSTWCCGSGNTTCSAANCK